MNVSNAIKPLFIAMHGERVILTEFREVDITEEYIGWLNNPSVVKYSRQRFLKHTYESCMQYFKRFEGTENLFLKINRKFDELFVGTLTIYYEKSSGVADVGILIGCESVWGTGIGQNAWNTVLNWLLSQGPIQSVTAGAMSSNAAMIRIMENSGMVVEAVGAGKEMKGDLSQSFVFYRISNDPAA